MFDSPSPGGVSFCPGRGRIVKLAFGAIHLLHELVAIGKRDAIALEDLVRRTSAEHWSWTVLVQVVDSPVDPFP